MEIQLNRKQQAYAAIGFGAVLVVVALLISLLGGKTTLNCTRSDNHQGQCDYKTISILNNKNITFNTADLKGSNVDCNTSRSSSGNTTSCNIVLNTSSAAGQIKMDYGNSKYEGDILIQNDKINAFAKDFNIAKLEVSQSNLVVIGIIFGILIFSGISLCLLSFIFLLPGRKLD